MGKREQNDYQPQDAEHARAEAVGPDAAAAAENPEMTTEQAETEIAREGDAFSRTVEDAAGAFAEETTRGLERIEKSEGPLLPEERAASEAISRKADVARAEFAQAVAAENREPKEGEPVRHTFEYRDAEGRLLGSAEIELDAEEVALDEMTVGKKEAGKGRALKSFVLRGEKDGKPTAVDVMAMINPHGADILVASGRLDNYSYDDERKRATVPMPETPLDIGVVMHELGHADQHHEDRFAPVAPLYELGRSAKADAFAPLSDVKRKLETIAAAIPEARAMIDPETMRELEGMEAEKNRLREKRDLLENQLVERKRERDAVVQETLARAVAAALPEGFSEDLERVFNELREEWDEKKWNEKTAEYVAVLEKAGFRFAAEAPAPEPEKAPKRSFSFDDDEPEVKKEKPPLRKDQLDGLDAVRSVVRRFRNGVDVETSKVSYSPDSGTIKAEVPFPAGDSFWDRRLDFELPMSEEEHASYLAALNAADVAVATAEAGLAEAAEALTAAARIQRERTERSNLTDIIKLPQRVLERDATRRAYQWMRKIRQEAGVDLFAAHKALRESTIGGKREARRGGGAKEKDEDCESSTEKAFERGNEDEWVETDVRTGLDEGLISYGAEHPPLKKRGS